MLRPGSRMGILARSLAESYRNHLGTVTKILAIARRKGVKQVFRGVKRKGPRPSELKPSAGKPQNGRRTYRVVGEFNSIARVGSAV